MQEERTRVADDGQDACDDHDERQRRKHFREADAKGALEEVEQEDQEARPLAERAPSIRRPDVVAAVFAQVDVPDELAEDEAVRDGAQKVAREADEEDRCHQ